MEDPPLHLVRAFVKVVERNSFARAAADLQVTPSSISRLVKALEQGIGTPLLHRTTRAMSLTDAGKRFFADSQAALAALAHAFEQARDGPGQPRGQLRLSAPVSFGRSHIVPFLPAFAQRHPELKLDLVLTDRYVDIVAEGVALAIRIGKLDDSSLVARRLLDNKRLLVAAPHYLAQHGTPQQVDDLRGHQCLVLSVNRDGELWRLKGPGKSCAWRPQGRLRADNGDAIRSFALAGMGIAFLSSVNAASALHDGTLVRVLPQWSGRSTGVYAVCPPVQPVSPAVRAMIDFLTKCWDADNYSHNDNE